MVGKTRTLEATTLVTGNDFLAILLTFGPCCLAVVGVDTGIEIQTGKESLSSVEAYMTNCRQL